MLKEAFRIKNMVLRNRLVMPPMATEKSNQGAVSDALCEYYRQRSGSIGLIIAEHMYIEKIGQASPGQGSIAEDRMLPGLKKLTETVHSGGAKIFAQISHAGGKAFLEVTGAEPLSASAIELPNPRPPRRPGHGPVGGPGPKPGPMPEPKVVIPKEMTHEDIAHTVSMFRDAAVRAKEAGFDGVEIHSAHSYLLNQFYSPLSNHRCDEYGGCLENRIRFHLEVVAAVREAVGPDYPIALRLGACDYMEGGSTLEDAVKAAVLLKKAGVDLLDISGGFCGFSRPDKQEPGYFGDASEAIRNAVNIPVLLTGGITEAADAERLLVEGKADLIGVGRAMLKNAAWAEQALSD